VEGDGRVLRNNLLTNGDIDVTKPESCGAC